ncbi:CxxC motif-containing protein [Clostridium algifaecis]|uniref:CxxC motif-containing protein n=1 Tax=Clostridium algifaecis TaxID=1472040 RepID=A0ABS4KVM9_9CLOT|nr:DUF1667 domain-containing protein [Clostridium algifaecis]MBP2034079.1 CxxC motif-containing protein [Clostridium algifaecis]
MFTDTIYKKDDKMIRKNYDVFTSAVRISGSYNKIIPVKSSKPIDKKLWIECSKALSRLHVRAPIEMGDIICTNILNTGVDIIATRSIKKL